MTESKTESRTNDPIERKLWKERGLVQVGTLRHGDVFETICGRYWRLIRETSRGIVRAELWGRDRAEEFNGLIKVRLVLNGMIGLNVSPEEKKRGIMKLNWVVKRGGRST